MEVKRETAAEELADLADSWLIGGDNKPLNSLLLTLHEDSLSPVFHLLAAPSQSPLQASFPGPLHQL